MWKRLKRILKPGALPAEGFSELFSRKYALFQELLASNAENLNLIADMEQKLRGDTIFGTAYVRSAVARAVFHTHRMVRALDGLSGGRYPGLDGVLEEISRQIRNEMHEERPPGQPKSWSSLMRALTVTAWTWWEQKTPIWERSETGWDFRSPMALP